MGSCCSTNSLNSKPSWYLERYEGDSDVNPSSWWARVDDVETIILKLRKNKNIALQTITTSGDFVGRAEENANDTVS